VETDIEKWIAGQKVLGDLIVWFFHTDDGAVCRRAFQQFLETNIEALHRHSQPPHLIEAVTQFAEQVGNLSNISEPSVRSLLRKLMGQP
jgi:hypothetical protein